MAITGIITDVDVFTEPLKHIADGEALNGEHFKEELQGAANRTRHLLNRVAAIESALAKYVSATYAVSGNAAQNAKLTLTAARAASGFALGSNEVTVPHAGVWLVTVSGQVTPNSVAMGPAGLIDIRVGGNVTNARGGGIRFSDDSLDYIQAAAGDTLEIDIPANNKISVTVGNPNGAAFVGALNIVYLHPLPSP